MITIDNYLFFQQDTCQQIDKDDKNKSNPAGNNLRVILNKNMMTSIYS